MPKRALCSLALLLSGLALVLPFLGVQAQAAPSATGIVMRANGTLGLAADAPKPPTGYAGFTRWGLWESGSQPLAFASNVFVFNWTHTQPAGTQALVHVRGLQANGRWTAWAVETSPGETVRLAQRVGSVQYRVVLLGNANASPTVGALQATAQPADLTMQAQAQQSYAPTYRFNVTREGLVGGRTANGHIIKKNDWFASLPSWSSLSSKGGNEYQVRITANGKSVVLSVWDVGPWNRNDNYWDAQRKTYRDLPRGWPAAIAAYYEGYNDGYADAGRVRWPAAVDIADGAFWALGLENASGVADVSFLWLGVDPGPNAEPLNEKPSQRPRLPDNATAATATRTPAPRKTAVPEPDKPTLTPTNAPAPTDVPTPTNVPTPTATPIPPTATPEPFVPEELHLEAKGDVFDANTTSFRGAVCENAPPARWLVGWSEAKEMALWRPALKGGTYEVWVHVPLCAGHQPTTQRATYTIHTKDGSEPTVAVNQAAHPNEWLLLGSWDFAPGTDAFVKLSAAIPEAGHAVWFDAVRWVRQP